MTPADRLPEGPFVIVSPEDWGELAPTNKHQIARALSRRWPVLYVNVAPTSAIRSRPWVRANPVDKTGLLTAVASVGLPVRLRFRTPVLLRIHTLCAVLGARRAFRQLPSRPSVALIYFPMPFWMARMLGTQTVVYHCVDHHASFPGSRFVAQALDKWEADLVRRADLVLASSQALADRLSTFRPDVHLLENVGDVELFSRAGDAARCRAKLEDSSTYTAFFHGTLSSHKVDFSFLSAVAESPGHPKLHVVGDAVDAAAQEWMQRLSAKQNVTWQKAAPQVDIAEHISRADVLVMPYALNDHTEYVFPIKLTEYLATGLPLVCAPLRSIKQFCGDSVYYADGQSAVEAALEMARSEAMDPDEKAIGRRALVDGRTWSARVEEIRHLIGNSEVG